MQIKLLHDLVEEMAGENTGRIVEILFGKKDVNEFSISKKMELTINQVRNILYKLSAEGLVTFIRKKDKRKGWYIYYWTLMTEKCLVKLEQSLIFKIEKLKGILNSRENERYYICKPCLIEVGEEKALEHGFSCEECAEIYELSDNSAPIKETKARIAKTERDLALINNELASIRAKDAKKRAREDKKAQKEALAKKELMKAARAAARKKVAATKVPKKGKKVVKKKATPKGVPTRGKKAAKKKVKKVVKKDGSASKGMTLRPRSTPKKLNKGAKKVKLSRLKGLAKKVSRKVPAKKKKSSGRK